MTRYAVALASRVQKVANMAHSSANQLHWKAYILGPVSGIPKLIGGLKRDDQTAAFHGAQATAFGMIFLLGLALLGIGLRIALPILGTQSDVEGMMLSIVLWLCYYFWIGGGLWIYAACLVTARSGGWKVSGMLTQCAMWIECAMAALMRK